MQSLDLEYCQEDPWATCAWNTISSEFVLHGAGARSKDGLSVLFYYVKPVHSNKQFLRYILFVLSTSTQYKYRTTILHQIEHINCSYLFRPYCLSYPTHVYLRINWTSKPLATSVTQGTILTKYSLPMFCIKLKIDPSRLIVSKLTYYLITIPNTKWLKVTRTTI